MHEKMRDDEMLQMSFEPAGPEWEQSFVGDGELSRF